MAYNLDTSKESGWPAHLDSVRMSSQSRKRRNSPKLHSPISNPDSHYLSTKEVSELVGVTLRQLQWWSERGVAEPSETNPNRLYSELNVATVTLVAALKRKHFSLGQIRLILRKLEATRMTLRTGARESFLVTDGKTVRVAEDWMDAAVIAASVDGRVAIIKMNELGGSD